MSLLESNYVHRINVSDGCIACIGLWARTCPTISRKHRYFDQYLRRSIVFKTTVNHIKTKHRVVISGSCIRLNGSYNKPVRDIACLNCSTTNVPTTSLVDTDVVIVASENFG